MVEGLEKNEEEFKNYILSRKQKMGVKETTPTNFK